MKTIFLLVSLITLMSCEAMKDLPSSSNNMQDYGTPNQPMSYPSMLLNPHQPAAQYYQDANGQWIREENNTMYSPVDTTTDYYRSMQRINTLNRNQPFFNNNTDGINHVIPNIIQKAR